MFKKVEYNKNYNIEHYDQIKIQAPKGKKAEWQAEAKRRNMSLSAFIQSAVAQYIAENDE